MITILCSMAGLGFYTPGVLIQSKLNKSGISSELLIVETLYGQKKQKNLAQMKKIFQKSYSVAQIAHKTSRDNRGALDRQKTSRIIKKWHGENRKQFIVLSGYWLPVLHEYAGMNQDISVDLCHLDSFPSTSWKMYDTDAPWFHQIWFADWASKKVRYTIKISDTDPVPFDSREERYFSHGGGWGIGTYQKKLPLLAKNGIPLDVTVNDLSQAKQLGSRIRYHMMAPDWQPYQTDEQGFHTFPPMREITDKEMVYRTNQDYPEAYNLIRRSKALIAKPGAATLLETFSSATPLIILKPYGEYEEKNGLLWESLGFGMSFEEWEDSEFNEPLLKKMNENMIAYRKHVPDYMERVLHVA